MIVIMNMNFVAMTMTIVDYIRFLRRDTGAYGCNGQEASGLLSLETFV